MTPVIALRGVGFRRQDRRVLEGIDLAIGPGERIGILGANGAGKTTLLRVIIGLERPDRGEVRFDGSPCRGEAGFRLLRAATGFLFQDPDDQLFCPTVLEDVAFGLRNQGLPVAEARALAAAQLADFGLAHLAERPVHRLSGGEKRLVCLAGLFVLRPRVLLLDEPTNALDAEAERHLLQHLDGYTGAIVLVTHRPGLLDRLGATPRRLENGRLHSD